MTPCKVDRGWQPNKEQEPQRVGSQKWQSQSRPRNEIDPKKGRTEGEVKSGKVQVGIDWTTTGIQKPVPKPDSRHPSFKAGASRASGGQQPRMKSLVKESQRHTSGSRDRISGKEGRSFRTSSDTQLGDEEKKELREKPYRWIESQIKCLDLASYVEEINSMQFFRQNASSFALQIVAIADWGRRFMEVGLNSLVPTFPDFLFTPLPHSHQGRSQVPVKPSQVRLPGGDVHDKSREAWKWMVAVLQFWGDEVSSADSIVYGSRECPISTLAEYVYDTINPCLEPGSKITWDDVIHLDTMDDQMIAWHDSLPGVDGQASTSTTTRRVIGAGTHPGKKILRAHFELCGKGKTHHPESHYSFCQTRHLTPWADQSRTRGPSQNYI